MTDSEIRQLAQKYAERFDVDNGDSLNEFSERVTWEVFPKASERRGLRQIQSHRYIFQNAVKSAVRELQKSGVKF